MHATTSHSVTSLTSSPGKATSSPSNPAGHRNSFLTAVDYTTEPLKRSFKKVTTIDDAIVPPFDPENPTPPPNTSFLQLREAVLRELPTVSSSNKKFWGRCLASEEVGEMIGDGFWWILEYVLKGGSGSGAAAANDGSPKSSHSAEEMNNSDSNSENSFKGDDDDDDDKSRTDASKVSIRSKGDDSKAGGASIGSNKSKAPSSDASIAQPKTDSNTEDEKKTAAGESFEFFNDKKKYRDPYFIRLARNYVKLFEKIPFARKDYFFGHYGDVLAFSILVSFYAAFPKSKGRIDERVFKQRLIDLCGEWISGFKSSNKCADHWVMDYDLAEGGKSAAERIKQMDSALSGGLGKGRESHSREKGSLDYQAREDAFSRPIRISYNLQHSPLMKTYLQTVGKNDTKHLNVRLGLTFAPKRPVITFDNGAAVQKSSLHAARQASKPSGLAMTRKISNNVEEERQTLMKSYAANKRDCHRNISEMRGWEAKAIEELANTEKKLVGSERTEFANVLCCNGLDQKM